MRFDWFDIGLSHNRKGEEGIRRRLQSAECDRVMMMMIMMNLYYTAGVHSYGNGGHGDVIARARNATQESNEWKNWNTKNPPFRLLLEVFAKVRIWNIQHSFVNSAVLCGLHVSVASLLLGFHLCGYPNDRPSRSGPTDAINNTWVRRRQTFFHFMWSPCCDEEPYSGGDTKEKYFS